MSTYRISRRNEECDCCYCGCPLFVGDTVHADEGGINVTCSQTCWDLLAASEKELSERTVGRSREDALDWQENQR